MGLLPQVIITLAVTAISFGVYKTAASTGSPMAGIDGVLVFFFLGIGQKMLITLLDVAVQLRHIRGLLEKDHN